MMSLLAQRRRNSLVLRSFGGEALMRAAEPPIENSVTTCREGLSYHSPENMREL